MTPKKHLLVAAVAAISLTGSLLVTTTPAASAASSVSSSGDPLVARPDGSFQWGELSVLGLDYDGAVVDVVRTTRWQDDVLGVDNGRWNDQIDYDVERGGEQFIIDFPAEVDDVVLTVGMLGANEGGPGNDEAGVWRAYDTAGRLLGTGRIDPDLSTLGPRQKERGYGQYPIAVTVDGIARLELEAIDWDADGSAPGRNNSDFGVVAISWNNDDQPPTTAPPTTQPPTTQPPTTQPPTTQPPTTQPPTTQPPTEPPVGRQSVSGADARSTSGLTLTGFDYDGAPADLGSRRGSVAVDGGRYDFQIDYDAATDRSERLVIGFDGGATDVVLDIDMLASSEWNGLDETGRWLARGVDGRLLGEGWIDPAVSSDRSFTIDADGVVGTVELTAVAYGRGIGTDRTTNNSDFAVGRISWTPATGTPSTTVPPTTEPPTTEPPTTEPPTTAPPTTEPPTTERVQLLPGDRNGSRWGDLVNIRAIDSAGDPTDLGARSGAFGPASGRYSYQLDYDAANARSESLVFDFDVPVADVALRLRHLEVAEWQGMNETGVWTALADDGTVVASGLIDPAFAVNGETSYDKWFSLASSTPFTQLRITATAYDHGNGAARTSNNSDFAVSGLDFTPVAAADGSTTTTTTSTTTTTTTTSPGDGDDGQDDLADAAVAVASGFWADPATWGGSVPAAGEAVVVPRGIVVDIGASPAPIGPLDVAGTIDVADGEISVEAASITVSGEFRAGSENDPFEGDLVVTLTGTAEHPMHGARALAVMPGGALELHGASAAKTSWTVLDGSVRAGDTTLVVAGATDWEVGDRIVLAPTGIEAFEDEVVTITAIDGRTVSFSPALRFDHHGQVETHAGVDLDMRGEVGLLSHDITITSAPDADLSRIGGHIMVMAGGTAHVEGVELQRLGQSGNAGRYPFHWHVAGDVTGQYFRNSAITDTFQRGVVIHGTSNALVEGVVAHNTFSHAFVWSEEGNEWGNRLIGNLAVRVENLARGSEFVAFPRFGRDGQLSLQASSQAETRSSGFWGRNPENTIVGNHVAGVDHGQGFFFDTRHMSYQLRQDMKTPRAEIVFTGNTAHTVEGISRSLYNYGPAARGHAVFVSTYAHHPVIEIDDFTAYHAVTGAWLEDENTVLVDSIVADSAGGVFVHHAEVRSSVIVGPTANDPERSIGLLADRQVGGGIHLTNQGRGKAVRLSDVTFVNVGRAGIVVRHVELDLPSVVSGLRFVDTEPVLVVSTDRKPVSGTILDADGSLCGIPASTVVLGDEADPC